MSIRASVACAITCLALGVPSFALLGCGSSTPEPTTAADDATPPPPEPKKKKAKPKCEALDENCVATPDTQARVAGSEFVFIPPEGWSFAQEKELTRTFDKEGGAVLAMSSYEPGSEEAKTREALFEALAEALEIALPEKFKRKYKPNWAKPDDKRASGDTELMLWQAGDAKHGTEKGYLLVLLAPDPSGRKVMGLAFAPESNEAAAEVIMKSLETLGPGSYQ
jgi:hypothetical protein